MAARAKAKAKAKAPATKRTKRRRPKHGTPKPLVVKQRRPPVLPDAIELIAKRATRVKGIKGSGPGGERWEIRAAGERAGDVYVNLVDEPPLGSHASIQIFLNRENQGRKIGRVGYERACAASRYSVIYAHIRKSNLPSIRAAMAAGFVDATPSSHNQVILVWRRA